MLGQPISMLIPEVVGFRVTGGLREGVTATDLVLTVTQMLRKHGVVGRFVEFYGPGLDAMPVEDRATIGNMAPEYGATCGYFPIDRETLRYLTLTGRDAATIALVEAYAKVQGIFRTPETPEPEFTSTLALDLASVEPSIAGPKRPQDRVLLSQAKTGFVDAFEKEFRKDPADLKKKAAAPAEPFALGHGDVVIAAITSCTNTSNPFVMMGAGLLARNAVKRGLKTKPWVKTSLAGQPGSGILPLPGLQADLDALPNLVGRPHHLIGTCPAATSPWRSPAICRGGKSKTPEGRVNPMCAPIISPAAVGIACVLAGAIPVDLRPSRLAPRRWRPAYSATSG
jgi:aconitate hydratase